MPSPSPLSANRFARIGSIVFAILILSLGVGAFWLGKSAGQREERERRLTFEAQSRRSKYELNGCIVGALKTRLPRTWVRDRNPAIIRSRNDARHLMAEIIDGEPNRTVRIYSRNGTPLRRVDRQGVEGCLTVG